MFGEKKRSLSRADIQMATKFGGPEEQEYLKEYNSSDTVPYCDKGGHKERSMVNSPQHLDHWKKEKYVQMRRA